VKDRSRASGSCGWQRLRASGSIQQTPLSAPARPGVPHEGAPLRRARARAGRAIGSSPGARGAAALRVLRGRGHRRREGTPGPLPGPLAARSGPPAHPPARPGHRGGSAAGSCPLSRGGLAAWRCSGPCHATDGGQPIGVCCGGGAGVLARRASRLGGAATPSRGPGVLGGEAMSVGRRERVRPFHAAVRRRAPSAQRP
jgi:hypothetical protein